MNAFKGRLSPQPAHLRPVWLPRESDVHRLRFKATVIGTPLQNEHAGDIPIVCRLFLAQGAEYLRLDPIDRRSREFPWHAIARPEVQGRLQLAL